MGKKAKFEINQVVGLLNNRFYKIDGVYIGDTYNWYSLDGKNNPAPESHGTYLETELRQLDDEERGQ